MDHRPLLRSQPEAEAALSRKRSGTLCSPPLARNGDSGGGQRRGRGRERGIEKGTTARPRLRLCQYGVVGRSQGRWVERFMQALRKAVILSTSRRCLESGVTHFSCCCLYCHDDDGVQQHVLFAQELACQNVCSND